MVWETLEGLSPNIPLFQPSSKQVKATPGWLSQLRRSSRRPTNPSGLQIFRPRPRYTAGDGSGAISHYGGFFPQMQTEGAAPLGASAQEQRERELPERHGACSNFSSNATHVLSPHVPPSKLRGQTSHWGGTEVSPPTGSPHRSH